MLKNKTLALALVLTGVGLLWRFPGDTRIQTAAMLLPIGAIWLGFPILALAAVGNGTSSRLFLGVVTAAMLAGPVVYAFGAVADTGNNLPMLFWPVLQWMVCVLLLICRSIREPFQ